MPQFPKKWNRNIIKHQRAPPPMPQWRPVFFLFSFSFFLLEGSRREIRSPRIYLVGRLRSRSRTTLREAEGKLMEANEERHKLFSAKSAPINRGRTMEDPTARAYEFSRGEYLFPASLVSVHSTRGTPHGREKIKSD